MHVSIHKDLNALECCVSVTSYFDRKFLASSVSVFPRSQSPEPHLAPSASVPIPFRGKNVKFSFDSFPGGVCEREREE